MGYVMEAAFEVGSTVPSVLLAMVNRPASAAVADCSCRVAPQTLSVVVDTHSDTWTPGPPGTNEVVLVPEQSLPAEKNVVTVAPARRARRNKTSPAIKKTLGFIILAPLACYPSYCDRAS